MREIRSDHGCGSVILNEQRVLVVAGGFNAMSVTNTYSVEFYVEGSNADDWIIGPYLPNNISVEYGARIVSDDIDVYYINTYANTFLKLECQDDLECMWTNLDLSLKTPRHSAVVSLIPDNLANCASTATTSLSTVTQVTSEAITTATSTAEPINTRSKYDMEYTIIQLHHCSICV